MKSSQLLALALAIIVGNALITWAIGSQLVKNSSDFSRYKSIGSRLQSAGLDEQAAGYYAKYLDGNPALANKERAAVTLAAAKLLIDAKQCPRALGLLYDVEQVAPDSAAAKESGKLIVQCLESTGHGKAARTAMQSRTSLTGSKQQTSSIVVASAGDLSVSKDDFESQFKSLPPTLQNSANSEEGQMRLLQQALANAALYEKAKARGLHTSDDVEARLTLMRRDLSVAALINSEVDSTPPSDETLHELYERNKQALNGQSFEQVRAQLEQYYLSEKISKSAQELSADLLENRKIALHPERVSVFPPLSADPGEANP